VVRGRCRSRATGTVRRRAFASTRLAACDALRRTKRRWTAVGATILVIAFTSAGLAVAIFPVTVMGNHLHEGAECGTAFIHSGPTWCSGTHTPYEVIALVLFGLAAVTAVALVARLRRTRRPH
jgi:hypothetical protein